MNQLSRLLLHVLFAASAASQLVLGQESIQLPDEAEKTLLQFATEVGGVESWQLVTPGILTGESSLVYAEVAFQPMAAGARNCVAHVLSFEGEMRDDALIRWEVPEWSAYNPGRYYWDGVDTCQGLSLSDAIVMSDLVDAGTLRQILGQEQALIDAVRGTVRCSVETNSRMSGIGLELDEQQGIYYQASLSGILCGSGTPLVHFNLIDGEVVVLEVTVLMP